MFLCAFPQLKNSLKTDLCLDQGPDNDNMPILYLCHGMTPQVSALLNILSVSASLQHGANTKTEYNTYISWVVLPKLVLSYQDNLSNSPGFFKYILNLSLIAIHLNLAVNLPEGIQLGIKFHIINKTSCKDHVFDYNILYLDLFLQLSVYTLSFCF